MRTALGNGMKSISRTVNRVILRAEPDSQPPFPSYKTPGALPVELWLMVLRLLDEHRTFQAAMCTCKALHLICLQLLDEGERIVCENAEHLRRIHIQLQRCVSAVSYKTEAIVSSGFLSRLAIELSGRYQRIRHLRIVGLLSGHPVSLHTQERLAFCQFKSTINLQLCDVTFSTFMEFARMVCSLPQLHSLWMFNVTYERGAAYDLSRTPFATSLGLTTVYANPRDLSGYALLYGLFTAPRLPETVETIHLELPPSHMSRYTTLVDQLPLVEYSNLKEIGMSLYLDSDDDVLKLGPVLVDLLSQTSQSHISKLSFAFYVSKQAQHSFSEFLSGPSGQFTEVDEALLDPQFASLENVNIYFHSLNQQNLRSLRRNHPFPATRSRNILECDAFDQDGRGVVVASRPFTEGAEHSRGDSSWSRIRQLAVEYTRHIDRRLASARYSGVHRSMSLSRSMWHRRSLGLFEPTSGISSPEPAVHPTSHLSDPNVSPTDPLLTSPAESDSTS